LIWPGLAALLVGGAFLFWTTVIASPALSFGGPGMVHFKDNVVEAGSEPLLCFEAVEWKRLCPGQTFTKLSPANVASRDARPIDIEPHTISTPVAVGALPPKCRATKIPAGLAPGIWKLSGHATSTCAVPFIGNVTVTAAIPEATITIK
jgi:hypothetical protein